MKKKVRQILTLWQDFSVISWLKSLPGNQTHGNYLFRKIGFFLGKFIYLMDAYEDVEKDIGNNSYNPLKEAFLQKTPEQFATECRTLLTMMMAECSREFEQLPILLHADILRNILYSGVWCRYTMVTSKRYENQNKENNHE